MDLYIVKSNLEQAKAQVIISKLKLDKCKIKAPYSGRLISKIINEFEFVRTDEPIMEIIDDNKLLAIFHLPSSELNNLKMGEKMYFQLKDPKMECSGTIYSISGKIDPVSRTIQAKALINNEDKKLRAGMSGYLLPHKEIKN